MVFIVAALVLATTALCFFSSKTQLRPLDLISFGVIILVVGFAAFVGYKRLSNAIRGEPSEDELSKKVVQKTAAWSYYISLYLWVAMIYIEENHELETDEVLGIGILGMALTYALCWIVFNIRGIRNE